MPGIYRRGQTFSNISLKVDTKTRRSCGLLAKSRSYVVEKQKRGTRLLKRKIASMRMRMQDCFRIIHLLDADLRHTKMMVEVKIKENSKLQKQVQELEHQRQSHECQLRQIRDALLLHEVEHKTMAAQCRIQEMELKVLRRQKSYELDGFSPPVCSTPTRVTDCAVQRRVNFDPSLNSQEVTKSQTMASPPEPRVAPPPPEFSPLSECAVLRELFATLINSRLTGIAGSDLTSVRQKPETQADLKGAGQCEASSAQTTSKPQVPEKEKEKAESLKRIEELQAELDRTRALHEVTKSSLMAREEEIHSLRKQTLDKKSATATNRSSSKTRLDEINEVIARSQERVQKTLTKAGFSFCEDCGAMTSYCPHGPQKTSETSASKKGGGKAEQPSSRQAKRVASSGSSSESSNKDMPAALSREKNEKPEKVKRHTKERPRSEADDKPNRQSSGILKGSPVPAATSLPLSKGCHCTFVNSDFVLHTAIQTLLTSHRLD